MALALIAAVISEVSVPPSPPPCCCGGPLSTGRRWVCSRGRHECNWLSTFLSLSAFPGFCNKDKLTYRQFLFVISWTETPAHPAVENLFDHFSPLLFFEGAIYVKTVVHL